jgi:hypothetical protein
MSTILGAFLHIDQPHSNGTRSWSLPRITVTGPNRDDRGATRGRDGRESGAPPAPAPAGGIAGKGAPISVSGQFLVLFTHTLLHSVSLRHKADLEVYAQCLRHFFQRAECLVGVKPFQPADVGRQVPMALARSNCVMPRCCRSLTI